MSLPKQTLDMVMSIGYTVSRDPEGEHEGHEGKHKRDNKKNTQINKFRSHKC